MNVILSGVSYGNCQEAIKKWGAPGIPYQLIREPDNPADIFAIRVSFLNDKLGYIPRGINKRFAEQMDAGKELWASFVKRNEYPGAERIGITVDIEEY